MIVPLIYYSIRDRYRIRRLLKFTFVAVLSSCVAIFINFAILVFQIATIQEEPLKGVDHIIWSFQRRSHANARDFTPDNAASLEARTSSVIWMYLEGECWNKQNIGTFLNINNYKIRFLYIVVIFLLASFILYFLGWNHNNGRQRDVTISLIGATWFSIMAPLSWMVVFKAHSYMHIHMNYIVWHMPFTFFGFATCGLVIKTLCKIIVGLAYKNGLMGRFDGPSSNSLLRE
jgi:hypothetical protein